MFTIAHFSNSTSFSIFSFLVFNAIFELLKQKCFLKCYLKPVKEPKRVILYYLKNINWLGEEILV